MKRLSFLALLAGCLALAVLVSCCDYGYIYGGVTYWRQPVYRCYNVVVDYVWDTYWGMLRPVYQTVCRWESIAPVDMGAMDIAGEYQAREDGVLVKTRGSDLAVDQVIKMVEGQFYSLIKVKELSERWWSETPSTSAEVGEGLPAPAT